MLDRRQDLRIGAPMHWLAIWLDRFDHETSSELLVTAPGADRMVSRTALAGRRCARWRSAPTNPRPGTVAEPRGGLWTTGRLDDPRGGTPDRPRRGSQASCRCPQSL